ncbi:hypothetical protein B0H13DRAFT_2382367 [Mycena leptocephala]|nr:hypothetical protein B0H13DRAFT_2382367 [Mycena leptocephala]
MSLSSFSTMERAYVEEDLKKTLKGKLLDPGLGFTTIQPEAAAATPSLSASTNAHHGPDTPHEEGSHWEECGPTEPVESDTAHVLRSIRLLINDRRSILSTTSTSQRFEVKFIDCDQCMDGEWRANASEILIALQNSIGRLAGSGRIGVPDRSDSSYTEYFVEMMTDEPTSILTTNPQLLIIPKDNRLNFRVDLVVNPRVPLILKV